MHARGWVVVIALAGCGGGNKAAPAEPSPAPTESHSQTDQTLHNQEAAESDAARASREADEARARADALMADLEAFDIKVTAAVDLVVNAQTDADRQAATQKLKALQAELAELKQRVANAQADAARAERKKGNKINQYCMENPLAKGCE